MKVFSLKSGLVELGVSQEGGHLWPVRFELRDTWIEPMHKAHWDGEALPDDLPFMLRYLRGDFFCAPFGNNDLEPTETRPHGATANGKWILVSSGDRHLELELAQPVLGARVRKRIHLNPTHRVVYQEHSFKGGSGRLPLGHHAMLRANDPLELSFSEWTWGGTPPEPVESDPARGRSCLEYPQQFTALERVRLQGGGFIDLTRYPVLEDSEDILMLAANPQLSFAWSAATNANAGWVWFALKDPRVLRSTLLWMSSGGRDYPPFSSRHRNVLGLEEVTSNFHLGHRASLEKSALSAQGISTCLELSVEATRTLRYAFGIIPVEPGFGRVRSIKPTQGGVLLEGMEGYEVFSAIDLSFITSGSGHDPS